MTEAGLNTVNLSEMTTWQQILLWLLIIVGGSIWVSIWTVLIRKHAFERRFQEIVEKERRRRHERRNASLTLLPISQRFRSFGKSRNASTAVSESAYVRHKGTARLSISNPTDGRPIAATIPPLSGPFEGPQSALSSAPSLPLNRPDGSAAGDDDDGTIPTTAFDHVTFADEPLQRAVSSSVEQRPGAVQRHLAYTDASTPTLTTYMTTDETPYHTTQKVGRNAQFHGLTGEEREKLGGTEYRALRLLSVIVPVYFVSWQLLGSLALGAWIATSQPQPALDNAISPWWNGIFNGVSAFNNSGSESIANPHSRAALRGP